MENFRPSFHVPAVWLTVDRPDGTVEYYQLDEEGNLVLNDGILAPHHIEKPTENHVAYPNYPQCSCFQNTSHNESESNSVYQ